MAWISVVNWRKFQHYDPTKRRPPWIKNHLDLMGKDEYRDLSAGCRAVLHGIWLEYASSQCQLKFDPTSISTRINLRVRKSHLETLVDAGFIVPVASKTLAEGYHDASARAHATEVEVETETENPSLPQPGPQDAATPNGRHPELAHTTSRSATDDLPL